MGHSKQLEIGLKRVYDTPARTDGLRILVERLWPRGLPKSEAAIDHWPKGIAPSSQLRRWYGHRPERWPEFQERYDAELDENVDEVLALESLRHSGPVTFVFAARDVERNSAVALKAYLQRNRTD